MTLDNFIFEECEMLREECASLARMMGEDFETNRHSPNIYEVMATNTITTYSVPEKYFRNMLFTENQIYHGMIRPRLSLAQQMIGYDTSLGYEVR